MYRAACVSILDAAYLSRASCAHVHIGHRSSSSIATGLWLRPHYVRSRASDLAFPPQTLPRAVFLRVG